MKREACSVTEEWQVVNYIMTVSPFPQICVNRLIVQRLYTVSIISTMRSIILVAIPGLVSASALSGVLGQRDACDADNCLRGR